MAQPQAYNREVDFTERDGDDTNHAGINAELDAAALSINQIRDNLALIQKDDGSLQNGIVGADQLAPSAFDAVKGELNEAVNNAQQAAESATLAASTAVGASNTAVASAGSASTSATNAATSAANAATAAQTLFNGLWLGAQANDPATDLNGQPLNTGDFYYNTASKLFRAYDASIPGFTNATPSGQFKRPKFVAGVNFTPGVTSQLTLASDPITAKNIFVFFDAAVQHNDQYALSGNTITFTSPIPVGTQAVEVAYLETLGQFVPADNSVNVDKLAEGSVIDEKVAEDAAIKATKIAFTQAGTGAVERTAQSKLREIVSIADFGADITGAASANAAITAAQTASAFLLATAGTYRITSNLTITSALSVLKGAVFSVNAGVTLTINGPFDAGLYQVFSGTGTVIFGGAAAVIEEFPEWRGGLPVVTCYGDSFTMGVSGGISYDQSYVALIAKAKNWNIPLPPGFGSPGILAGSVGNQAFGGSQISSTEQINRIMAHTTTDTDIQFILTGFNDMRAFGYNSAGVSTYRQTLQAALAWMSIPASSTEKLFANSSDPSRVSRTGTGWTANTSWFNGQGYHTTIQGDAFNFTVFGDTIYMALPRDIYTTGKCSITVDGVNYGTYDFSGNAAAIQYNKTYSMGFVRITGLQRGYHGVILTKTSPSGGGDYMRVDWVAGVDGMQSAQGVMGGPQVFVGNCCRMKAAEYTDPRHGAYVNGSDAVVNGYNTMIEQCVRELAADGLNITYVDVNKYFDPNSPDLDPDLVHPSAIGMQKIANAFLERMDERKIHPKDRGVVDTGQKFIGERWTPTSLGTVVNFGDESKTSMFGSGGNNTLLSHNIKLVEGSYFRINELKAAWQITLGDATNGPTLLYKAAGSGQITSWDKVLYIDGSYQPWLSPTLLNGWVNASAAWTPARYLKDSNGFVHLGGLIGSGTIAAAAFVLPAGFRPSGKMGFPIVSNSAFGWVSILADGTVTVEAGSAVWASLEGITFKAV